MYKHGIEVTELATRYEDPLATRFGVQVVVGTAPVFKVDVLWSSIFVTLVAKKYHESVTLPSGLRMVYDNH